MDTQNVTTEYRLSQWAQVIQARLDSGQSIKDFCLVSGITRNTFFYWQKRLRNLACTNHKKSSEATKPLVPNGWIQLAPSQPQQMKASLDIEINGCRITADADTDPELLKKVCRVLKSI
jgi:putative transposase